MKERINELINTLNAMRDEVLNNYLEALKRYSPEQGSVEAVERAGILHDLDKHITNLEMEVKRAEAVKPWVVLNA
jgi:hypothetical protein